jgi:hypothetical protein
MPSIHIEPEPTPFREFYQHIALYPENGLYRRFGAYWAKRVHDETSELRACIAELNDKITLCNVLEATSVLDCPLRVVKAKCPKGTSNPEFESLYDAWGAYEEALKRHGSLFVRTTIS